MFGIRHFSSFPIAFSKTKFINWITFLSIWMVVLGFNTTLTAKVISWQSVMYMFPGFLTPVLTQLFFPKPPNTFLTCFCRGERWKYAGKKVSLNWGWYSQPTGHESNTLTTEPPWRGPLNMDKSKIVMSDEEMNPLPSNKILGWSNLREFADYIKLKVAQIAKCVQDRVENNVGKGENAGYQHFLLFPECFKKASFEGSLKPGMVWWRIQK